MITSWFPLVSIPLGIIGTIFAFFLGGSTADIITRLSAAIDKTDEKQDLICDLVPRMATPKTLVGLHLNRMTDNDIAIAFTRFQDIVAPHADVMKLLKFFPVTEWKQITAERAETESCGCEDFLPYQYVPASQAGSIQFMSLINTGAIADAPLAYLAGEPLELYQTSNPHGQVLTANQQWRTVYSGADTAYGQNNKYTRLGMILEMPALTTIDSILYDLDIVGVPAGAIWQAEQVWMSRYLPGTGWGGGNLHAERALTDATDISGNLNAAQCTYLTLAWRTVNTNENLYAVISNLRFTGTIGGQGFLNKAIGEPLT